jgi:type I restriction enzyme S subunit
MKELRIKDICEKGSSNLKQKDVEGKNGLYPVYGASGIISHIDTYHQEDNYIAIVKDGSGIGRVTFMPAKSSVIGTMQYILPKEGFNINYIGYCLQSLDLSKYKQGAAIPHIYFRDYGERIVKVTEDVDEQQSIVDYLDSAFAKIEAMKANAEKALNEAKALFQASLKEMLEPKEEWEEKKLGDICSDIRYGTSTPSNENGEYKYLRMNNITNDGFLDVSHYKTISLPEKELEKCLVKKGDIIFNRTNSRELVGKSCVFTEDENMVIAGYLIRIRLKEGFEPQFITYNMNLQRSMGLFQHLIVGAVHQANISANNIQKVLISYPPLSEQQSIVSALDSLKSKVDKLQENYDKISQECDALKQAMLRQVFE